MPSRWSELNLPRPSRTVRMLRDRGRSWLIAYRSMRKRLLRLRKVSSIVAVGT